MGALQKEYQACSGDCEICDCEYEEQVGGESEGESLLVDPVDNPDAVINELIQSVSGLDKGKISDGYHTFDELYRHRCVLFVALCKARKDSDYVWRSRKHSDGSGYEGWFVLGIGTIQGQQITYHLPDSMWESCAFSAFRDRAPHFDGHTSEDVLERLLNL